MVIQKGKRKKSNALNRKHSITSMMIMIVMPLIIISSILFFYMSSVVNNKNFYKGIDIGGIKADGKSKEAILKELKVKFRDEEQKIQISLQYGDQQWIARGKDIHAEMDYLKKIDEAYQLGRSGNLLQRFFFIKAMGSTNRKFILNYLYNVQELQSYINDISKDIERDVQDARVEFQPKKKQKFIVIPERSGRKVAMDQIIKDVNSKFNINNQIAVPLQFIKIQPKVLASDIQKLTTKIASFSTSLGASTDDRKHNVFLAADSFNGKIILASEIFSFNDTTGERSLDRGYRNAPIIARDKSLEDGPGGGVCQASTTLYNTVLLSGLEVITRSHHSFPSSYVKPGFDATVNYPATDLKFRNNRLTPIFMASYQSGNNLTVEIYGEPIDNNISYKLINDVYEEIPAPDPDIKPDIKKEFIDKVRYIDEKYEKIVSRKGIKVKTYRVIYKDGHELKRELIVDDYYKSIKGLVYTGIEVRPLDATPSPEPTPTT